MSGLATVLFYGTAPWKGRKGVGRTRQPPPHTDGAVVRNAGEAIRRARVSPVEEAGPAAHHPAGVPIKRGISRIVILIQTPFPEVAAHVQCTYRRGTL